MVISDPEKLASYCDVSKENTFFALTNKYRKSQNLPMLKRSSLLDIPARWIVMDCGLNNFFAHESEQLGSLTDRFEALGIGAETFGENLAHVSTANVLTATNGLISSKGHRENMLNPAFNHLGVGSFKGTLDGINTTFFAQIFAKNPIELAEYNYKGNYYVR